MAAIHESRPSLEFEIFTQMNPRFFEESLEGPFVLHQVLTDVGLVQRGPLEFDLPETVQALDALVPFDPATIEAMAAHVRDRDCRMVLCDIAPMGIAVAARAGVPSLLVENFTWDWIYEPHAGTHPGLARHMDYLGRLYAAADYHLQTEPVCRPAAADRIVLPISRKPKSARPEVRKALGVPEGMPVVLVTMGGIPGRITFLDKLKELREVFFVATGMAEGLRVTDNLLLLPRHSGFFHPDLIGGADAVVGKAGYSTTAEIYYAGARFGYVVARGFREAQILASYIRENLSGLEIDEGDFEAGRWLDRLPDLLLLPGTTPRGVRGADQAAEFILKVI